MMTIFQPFANTLWDPFQETELTKVPRTDLRDTGDSYVLEADMPGFRKEEIKLSLEGDVLTIAAEHTAEKKTESAPKEGEVTIENAAPQAEAPAKKGTYLQRERSFCKYLQRLDISNVDAEHMDAAYENGVLILTMPKKQPAKPEVKEITIQ